MDMAKMKKAKVKKALAKAWPKAKPGKSLEDLSKMRKAKAKKAKAKQYPGYAKLHRSHFAQILEALLAARSYVDTSTRTLVQSVTEPGTKHRAAAVLERIDAALAAGKVDMH
jgi:hypothetical protein